MTEVERADLDVGSAKPKACYTLVCRTANVIAKLLLC
jgi:hypothetical protein